MPFADVRIDEALWSGAAPERRTEWLSATRELLEEHHITHVDPLHIHIRLDGGDTLLEATRPDGSSVTTVTLPMRLLATHFQEYIGICRDLGSSSLSLEPSRFEALDIAKRMSHDEAADTLVTLVASLGADHATCRRLFTLLVTLHFDTTRLTLPHHRRR